MFGLIDDVLDLTTTAADKAIDIALQPVADGIIVFQGLTEGELRTQAALRLGADVVSGMAVSEIIEAITE